MDNNIKSNTSFWSEISEYEIQVPYYQRDYAQGRIDNGRIDNIRKVFVEELYGALTGQKKCHLGLVFGSYNENEKVFIAVDGQQRLTTVFLLHWYVAWRENKLNDYKEKLLNFSWDTRSYSSQFVELLFKFQPSNNVIEAIKTNSNYFSVWENDPTVKGMLTMLKEIEVQYPKEDCSLCNNLFSDNCNIQYDILKLKKDSDGKTYLKMNSRGRSLTTFELFKSKFLDKYKPNFENKIDNDWLTFILNKFTARGSEFSDPDIPFMNFINEYTYLQLKLKSAPDNSNDFKEFVDAKVKGELTDVPFISFDKYTLAFDNNIVCFEKFFDWIIDNHDTVKTIDDELRFPKDDFFIEKIINSHNPDFSHRAKFFSLFKYAELTKYAIINVGLYMEWNRVFRNLVANTDIDGSKIGGICKSINKINNSNIYCYLSNGGELTAFTKEQVAEETTKAKQILDENGALRKYNGSDYQTWEEIIIEAEKYAFFKGAIRFLFTKQNIGDDWKSFDTKWGNAKKYFDENGVKVEYKVKLTRALAIQCNNWDEQLYNKQIFNPNANTWKWILCSSIWNAPIHNILNIENLNNITPTENLGNEGANKSILSILATLPYEYFVKMEPNGRFRWNGKLGFYRPWGQEAITFDWGDFHRNELLNKLFDDVDKRFSIDPKIKVSDSFFRGWNIPFKFQFESQQYVFQWDANGNVYLVENGLYKLKNEDPKEYFCFNAEGIDNTSIFIKKLEDLINSKTSNE